MNASLIELQGDLPRRVAALVRDNPEREAFLRALAALCAATPEAPWETLALVDQFYRRGKLSPELFAAARTSIERRVLGFQEPATFLPCSLESKSAGMPDHAPSLPASTPTPLATPAASPAAAGAPEELDALRAELAAARRQAALYLERLSAEEWRRSAGAELRAPAAGRTLAPDSGAPQPRPAVSDSRVRRRRVTLGALCAGVVVAALALAGLLQRAALRSQAPLALPHASLPRRPATARPVPPEPGTLALDDERIVVASGATEVRAVLRREGGGSGQVGIEWWTVGLGARPGIDYAALGHQRLVLADGQQQAELVVPLLRNPARRHTEMFELRIAAPTGGAGLGPVTRATVFLLPPARLAATP